MSADAARVLAVRRIVVFDLDGTLVDTLADLVEALNDALAEVGASAVPADLVRRTLHGGLEATAAAAALRLDLDPTRAAELPRAYAHHYSRAPARASRPYPGVPGLLDRLHRRGARMAVCTNKDVGDAERVLAETGLLGWLRATIGADDRGWLKPDPRPLHCAIAALDGHPADAVLVGDSMVDVATARAAGVDCLLHTGGYGDVLSAGSTVAGRFGSYVGLLSGLPDRPQVESPAG